LWTQSSYEALLAHRDKLFIRMVINMSKISICPFVAIARGIQSDKIITGAREIRINEKLKAFVRITLASNT